MDKEQEILSTDFLKGQNLIDYEDNEIVLIDDMKYIAYGHAPQGFGKTRYDLFDGVHERQVADEHQW